MSALGEELADFGDISVASGIDQFVVEVLRLDKERQKEQRCE
jgi:hypothetical protein